MRDQYAGDVSDFFKYHFIRSVAVGRRIGMAWYYIPTHDGRNDGKHIEWRMDGRFASCDPELATALSTLGERSVSAVEHLGIWPADMIFHRVKVPSPASRSRWSAAKRNMLEKADFVFCDPDNGIGITDKHLTIEEIRRLRRDGRAVAFITFPARVPHEQQVARLHERLHDETETRAVLTIRTSIMVRGPNGSQPRARWFTVIDGDGAIREAGRSFGEKLRNVLGAKVAVLETGDT